MPGSNTDTATIQLTTDPTAVGTLTAVLVTDGLSSNAGAQTSVATVVPGVTQNTANLGYNATTVTINGNGFSTTNTNDKVSFDGGTTWITASTGATANQLKVSYTPTALGSLSAKVQVTSGGILTRASPRCRWPPSYRW
jgi:hypothetical protein